MPTPDARVASPTEVRNSAGKGKGGGGPIVLGAPRIAGLIVFGVRVVEVS